jgi:hypothetical protein
VRADQGQGQTMMFGHMVLLDCISGAVRFSMSTRLQACHPKVLDPPPSSSTSVLLDRFMVGLALLAFRARFPRALSFLLLLLVVP